MQRQPINLIISFNDTSLLKHLIIKQNNLTIYYKGFDELIALMTLSDEIDMGPVSTLTYVTDHMTSDSPKELYHQDIDPSYSEDGHYHFERKDKQPFTESDLLYFTENLLSSKLITSTEFQQINLKIKELFNEAPIVPHILKQSFFEPEIKVTMQQKSYTLSM